MNEWLISSCEVIEKNILLISLNTPWFQEDLEEIRLLIFSAINSVIKIEDTLGADRENTRFIWQNHYFTLNFECYSQSCWVELEGQANDRALKALQDMLPQLR